MVFTPAQWQSLPLALRQRWWRETNYGEHAPSGAALLMEILVVLAGYTARYG